MIQLTTPVGMVLNEAEKNECVCNLLNEVDLYLRECKPSYSHTFNIGTTEKFSNEELELIKQVFSAFGWDLVMSSKYDSDDEIWMHRLILTAKYK